MARPRHDQRRSAAAAPAEARRRWSSERDAHLRQINAFSFLVPSRPRRSATTVPTALRYTQHVPAGRAVRLLVLLAGCGYAALQIWEGASVGRALALAVVLAVVVLAVSTFRLTVGTHGLSFDIAGLRQASSFGFVPLYAVRDARVGPAPQDWPQPRLKGGWWPGRRRVNVLHLDENGAPQAFHVCVADSERFGTALLGRPLSDD